MRAKNTRFNNWTHEGSLKRIYPILNILASSQIFSHWILLINYTMLRMHTYENHGIFSFNILLFVIYLFEEKTVLLLQMTVFVSRFLPINTIETKKSGHFYALLDWHFRFRRPNGLMEKRLDIFPKVKLDHHNFDNTITLQLLSA